MLCRLLGQNLVFAGLMAGFRHLALLCRSCKRYENFSLVTHLLQISLSSNKPRIDRTTRAIKQKYPQDAPRQKLSILLLKPCRSTICHHISSFDKISIKSSKNNDLLAILVKFSQASDPHLSRQQKFVKKHSIHTA